MYPESQIQIQIQILIDLTSDYLFTGSGAA